jgi:hypothetical protein
MWPAVIVQQLFPILPEGYVAAPRVHLGKAFEDDASAVARNEQSRQEGRHDGTGDDEYETRVYDMRNGRRLVAAVEIVSPSSKDRPESRREFVAKVAALLQHDVSVSFVDVVTIRQFNLYADLLELIDRSDPMLGAGPPSLYAVTARVRKRAGDRPLLDTWFYPMVLGEPLPTLPIWLDADLGVLLNLETTYEQACQVLRIA